MRHYGFGYLNDLADRAHKNSREHGFWDNHYGPLANGFHSEWADGTGRPQIDRLLSCLALITSEIGEAVEAARHNDRSNFAEELADIVIRVMDLAKPCGVNLEQAIVDKMNQNETRPHMHGKLA